MPAICPTNSTDCLLRALVDANTGYDWNPLNFGFTAALSILGFIVAIVALFQALLAAGPGRLKASSSAVGETYAKQSNTRFDRTELRFRTVAKVPLIDVSELAGEPRAHESSRSSRQRFALPGIVSKFFAGKQVRRTGAGWARLLEDLSLADYPFTTMDCETDYLPDDVQAAPAYATINDIIMLAMLAGCHTLTESDEWPRARGPNIQLDFRSHPFLGTVAVYQHYGMPAKVSFDQRQLKSVMQSARGQLNYCGERLSMAGIEGLNVYFALSPARLITAIEGRRTDCGHHRCPSGKDIVPSWKDFFSSDPDNHGNLRNSDRITALLFSDKLTGLGLYPSEEIDFHTTLRAIMRDVARIEFEYTDIENDLKSLVGTQNGELKTSQAGAEATAQHVQPWSSADNSTWFEPTSGTNQDYRINKYEGTAGAQLTNGARHREVLPDEQNLKSTDLVLSFKALSYCVSWMNDKTYFEKLKPENRAAMRNWLDFQLCEVDFWLRCHGGQDSLCAALSLIKKTAAIRRSGFEYEVVEWEAPRLLKSVQNKINLIPEIFTKVEAKRLEVEALEAHDLPWEYDPDDGSYLRVNAPVDDALMKKLLEYTKQLRQEKEAKAAQGDVPAEVPPFPLVDLSGQFENAGKGEKNEAEDPAVTTNERDLGIAPEPKPQVPQEELQQVPDLSPLKLMETLLLYRAVLMACSLAARSDTSKLLTLRNRDQVVQVL